MAFCVKVPVLSEQITEVAPNVSTEDSFLTKAWSLAMRWTAMAKDRVTVGRSPSGIKATIIPNAKIKAWDKGWWTNRVAATIKKRPTDTAITEICLVKRSNSFWRGLFSWTRFCVKSAICPNSVFIPIADTIKCPEPEETVVPANTILSYSNSVLSGVKSAWSDL